MEFRHIAEALAYAKETGDTEALKEYTRRRTNDAAKKLMPVFGQNMPGDDIYFLLAYSQALLKVTQASMLQKERDLIRGIESGIQITLVKTTIPQKNSGEAENT
ncbi:MAG: hypothetical protein K6C08_07880 [Oscillospiraceae bacterium]|nr:hypothetical protein [Oscillospiraceae bacterium]